MLTKREKKMISILGIIIVIAVYYKFIFSPQVNKLNELRTKLNNYNTKVKIVEDQISPDSKTNFEYKVLNYRISKMYEKLLPEIFQEKIIVLLDNIIKDSKIVCTNIVFTEPKLNPLEENKESKSEEYEIKSLVEQFFNKDKDIDEENKEKKENNYQPKIQGMKTDINFIGSYENLLNFISLIENYDKKILIRNLNINTDEKNNLVGNIQLDFISIPKLHQQDEEFLKWNLFNEYGRNNPFYIDSNEGNVSQFISIYEKKYLNNKHYDFAMTVKPFNADLPTVILEKADDETGKTSVYADKNSFEDVELNLSQKDGQYFYKYKTSRNNYRKDFSIANTFNPIDKTINIKIYTQKRNSDNDMSGVNLKILNNTDKKVFIYVMGDDPDRPRVNVISNSNKIIIKKD